MVKVFLTGQQAHVLRLLATGLTTRQIAWQMGVTERAVYGHISKLKARLAASNRAQILLQAERFCPEVIREENKP